jgi:hypothetical protein
MMITEYYRFDGTVLNHSDTIVFQKSGNNYDVHISNEKKNDTNFVISLTGNQLFLLKKNTKILTHDVKKNKMIKSQIQTTFFTPYLTNNSIYETSKTFRIENSEYIVYRYLENIFDDKDENGYSYYLKDVGFIANINTKSEYYWVIKKILNSNFLSDSHREKLIKSLKEDSIFFKNKRYIPPIPKEFR